MNIIDKLLNYLKNRDKKILITTDIQISTLELTVVVVNILSWMKLEHKRSIWIAEGRKNCFKPLEVDAKYPWCADLYELVEKEKSFHDYFSIRDGKFDFSEEVSEENRIIARKKVYENYNPERRT